MAERRTQPREARAARSASPPARTLLAAALLTGAAGCIAPAPIEGAALERLRAGVAALGETEVRIASIGPDVLARGGPGATIVLPFESHGTRVAEFSLYDAYFKTAFVLVEELRGLGFQAGLSPAVWVARHESVAREVAKLTDEEVSQNLIMVQAQESVADVTALAPAQRREVLASRQTLVAARSALPTLLRAKPGGLTGREIRDAFFADDRVPSLPLLLEVEATELEAVAEEDAGAPPVPEPPAARPLPRPRPGEPSPPPLPPPPERLRVQGERHGRALLHFRLRRPSGVLVAEADVACAASSEGTGVTLVWQQGATGGRIASYQFALAADDPLERAIRGALRAFVRDALPALRGP